MKKLLSCLLVIICFFMIASACSSKSSIKIKEEVDVAGYDIFDFAGKDNDIITIFF